MDDASANICEYSQAPCLACFQDIQIEIHNTDDFKYVDDRIRCPGRYVVWELGSLRTGRRHWFLFHPAGRKWSKSKGVPLRRCLLDSLYRDRRLLRENLLHRSENRLQK